VSDANKDLVRRMEDTIFNQRKLEAIDTFISPNYVLRTAPEGTPAGPTAYAARWPRTSRASRTYMLRSMS
jgi:hypothetical protein